LIAWIIGGWSEATDRKQSFAFGTQNTHLSLALLSGSLKLIHKNKDEAAN
jgi:hypothetical protein